VKQLYKILIYVWISNFILSRENSSICVFFQCSDFLILFANSLILFSVFLPFSLPSFDSIKHKSEFIKFIPFIRIYNGRQKFISLLISQFFVAFSRWRFSFSVSWFRVHLCCRLLEYSANSATRINNWRWRRQQAVKNNKSFNIWESENCLSVSECFPCCWPLSLSQSSSFSH